jgi:hypothetical protein
MTTIPIEAEISTEQLLRAVSQLPPEELAAFVDHVLALHAERAEPRLSQSETALLLQVNEGVPATTRQRFNELVAKRQAEAITPTELDELKIITDEFEQYDARRLAALDALARLKRMTLADLMDSLGISPPTYA